MGSVPIDHPGKIIAVGLNYRDHAGEATVAAPTSPILFAKWGTCLIGPDEPIVIPAGIEEVDWEAELAVVIGKTARGVGIDDALDFVKGYTCMNDVSAQEGAARRRPVDSCEVVRHVRPGRPAARSGERDS